MSNDMEPNQITEHEDDETGESLSSGRILPETDKHLQHHKYQDIRVHDMIQPTTKKERKKYS